MHVLKWGRYREDQHGSLRKDDTRNREAFLFFVPLILIFVTDSLNFVLMAFLSVYVAPKSWYETVVRQLE